MRNITTDHYKKAIREKYEKEKNGDNSYYLEVPSQAKLRDLCWKIFITNDKKDDLKIFSLFFKSEFNPTQEVAFNQYIDKFKPIGSFLKGKKEPANFHTVELASILVDFELRPYSKFRKYFTEEENATENTDDLIVSDLVTDKNFQSENVFVKSEESLKLEETPKEVRESRSVGLTSKEDLINKEPKIIKPNTWFVIGIIILLSGLCYYFSQKKECMQWSNDHYEEVSCDLKVESIGAFNKIEPSDKSVLILKKIKVTNKTVFFKDGEAIVWYAKTAHGIEFFNTHGRHPENGRALKPVSDYIIKKYVNN
ncbi:hypothetical protein [Flavobacterium sp. TAB 87]|uniref:hypothetical protein n=1 Tax=Flavobacterium sp. TAB 87 TaxID=1729581 RepID=UPI00076C4326|nr:hypothetical protein [Flavobacterium sp. TAB 87]KVV14367.1 hypothetical protein AP058_02259 [Flavobacterium sp. TAB 87]